MPHWTIEIDDPDLNMRRVISGDDKRAVELEAGLQKYAWKMEYIAKLRTNDAKEQIRLCESVLADALTNTPDPGWSFANFAEDITPPSRVPGESQEEYDLKVNGWNDLRAQYKKYCDEARVIFETLRSHYKTGAISSPPFELFLSKFWEKRIVSKTLNLDGERITLDDYDGKIWKISSKLSFITDSFASIIDCDLPVFSDLPRIKWVKFSKPKQLRDLLTAPLESLFSVISLKQRELHDVYEKLLYQICLATIFLIFVVDDLRLIRVCTFNGWVTTIDPATGREVRACILSIGVDREVFDTINLARVDPRACFRSLKGVGSAQLRDLIPVAPITRGNHDDPRFVEGREIADRLRDGTNLAAIGWEDFEHLIREVFEMEFKIAGGEVHVTRASRDWGVDAIAFDPDPIRGGKIVIQAKRYTNTVEVSAVRDLYGTVVNEGALKGILVTTSTFGPEAYAFARDKPLTLLDGSNLLHLLERHGRQAYIDLAEAKRLNLTPLARTNPFADGSSRE